MKNLHVKKAEVEKKITALKKKRDKIDAELNKLMTENMKLFCILYD